MTNNNMQGLANATCSYHPDRKAVINCFQCTKYICESCRKFSFGYIYCPNCFELSKCKTQFQTVDKFEYKPHKHGIIKKIFKFLFKFSFRMALLGCVYFGFQNKDFLMNWVFKSGYANILKNISPELANNLLKNNKISNPMDIIKNPVANIQMQAFASGLEYYKTVYGTYPNDFESFLKNNFDTKSDKIDITVDGWGRSYKYVNRGDSYELTSAGPDGEFNTDDDISYGTRR